MKYSKFVSRNLWLYFLIAFVSSWIFWVPQALISSSLLLAPSIFIDFLFSPFNPAAFGPLVSSFSPTYLNEGKRGNKEFAEKRSRL